MVGNVDVATPTELLPLIPPQAGEKGIDDSCRFFLDSLMEFMITQVTFFLVVILNQIVGYRKTIFIGDADRMEG
jgi:hypothetical protein